MTAADTFDRAGACSFLCSRGAWTQQVHLVKLARRGDGPAFSADAAGEPTYSRDALVAWAAKERQRISRQREVKAALAATRHKRAS